MTVVLPAPVSSSVALGASVPVFAVFLKQTMMFPVCFTHNLKLYFILVMNNTGWQLEALAKITGKTLIDLLRPKRSNSLLHSTKWNVMKPVPVLQCILPSNARKGHGQPCREEPCREAHTTPAKQRAWSCCWGSGKVLPKPGKDGWSYWLQGGSQEDGGGGGKEGGGGEKAEWDRQEFGKNEGRGIYTHNFAWIRSLCQICDVLWWMLLLQWLISSDSCWGIKAVIFKEFSVLLDALYK